MDRPGRPWAQSASHGYFAERDGKPATLQPSAETAQRSLMTLHHGARTKAHNHAVTRKLYLEAYLFDQQK